MDSGGFFRRWSKLKRENDAQAVSPEAPPAQGRTSEDGSASRPADDKSEEGLPTLADVARLTADSDYSAFVAPGVDRTVRRMALKKLFSDPHFNIMDGLDIYISDYNKPDPMPAAMLASLRHAQNILGRGAEDTEQDNVSQEQEQENASPHARRATEREAFLPANGTGNPSSAAGIHKQDTHDGEPFPDQSSPGGSA